MPGDQGGDRPRHRIPQVSWYIIGARLKLLQVQRRSGAICSIKVATACPKPGRLPPFHRDRLVFDHDVHRPFWLLASLGLLHLSCSCCSSGSGLCICVLSVSNLVDFIWCSCSRLRTPSIGVLWLLVTWAKTCSRRRLSNVS